MLLLELLEYNLERKNTWLARCRRLALFCRRRSELGIDNKRDYQAYELMLECNDNYMDYNRFIAKELSHLFTEKH